MDYDSKLDELFIDLPQVAPDKGPGAGALQCGKMLYVSGSLPFSEGRVQHQGRAGIDVKIDNAKLAARTAAIYSLGVVSRELGGSLNSVKRVVKIDGFVACGADFKEHQKVIDGAGELFIQIFGQNGKAARMVAGVTSLPQNACVEIAVIFEIK